MFSLKDFIRAMKKANRKQVYGRLFIVDAKTDEVCGCALGQALLETGEITENQIRKEIKANGYLSEWEVFDPDKQEKVRIQAYADANAERKYNKMLEISLPSGFTSFVIGENDNDRKPLSDIIPDVIHKFLPDGF